MGKWNGWPSAPTTAARPRRSGPRPAASLRWACPMPPPPIRWPLRDSPTAPGSRSMPRGRTITIRSRRPSRRLPAGWWPKRRGAGWGRSASRSSSIRLRSWKSRWARPPGSDGRASTPTSSAATMAHGCSSARSTPRSTSRPMQAARTAAAPAMPASRPAPPRPSPPLTGSMPAAASPISPSSMPGRFPNSSALRWATASTAATIASPSARGTSSPPPPRPTVPSSPARNWPPPALPNCSRWMTRAFAACSPAARSSGSAATDLCAIASMPPATATIRLCSR